MLHRIEQAEISSPGVKIAPTLFGYGPESYLIGPDGPQFKSLPNYEEIWGSIPRHPEGERGITFHRSGLPIQLAVIGVDEDLTPVDTASKIPEYYLGILPVTVANTEHVQFLSGHKEIHAAEEIPPCITIILKPRSAVGSDLVRVSHTPKFGGYGFLYTSHSPPSGLYLSRWIARFVTGNPVRIKILEFYIPSRLPGDSNNNYTCQLGPEGIVTWNLRVPKIQSGHFDIEIVELAWRFKLEGQNLSYHTTRYGSTKVYPFETSGRISSRAHTYGYGAFIGHLWDPHRCEGLMFALVTSIDPGSKLEHCILDIRCTAATNVDWLKPEAVLKALLRSCKDPPYQPEVSEDYVGGHDDAYESNVKWKDDEIKHRDTPPPLLKSSYMAFGDIGLGQTVRILPLPLSKRWIKVEICSEHPGEPLTYLKTTLTIKMIGF